MQNALRFLMQKNKRVLKDQKLFIKGANFFLSYCPNIYNVIFIMKIRMLPQQLLLRYDHFEGRSDFILAHFLNRVTSSETLAFTECKPI